MSIKIGDKAPSFTLKSSDKTDVSLEDFKGKKLVLLFIPGAYSGVCTAELCSVRDEMAEYQHLDAEVCVISVDTPFVLHQFKKDNQYPFTMLSDFNKVTCQDYDAFYEEFVLGLKGVARRAAFVIDRDGIVRYAEVLENGGEHPNFAEVKKALESIA